MILQLGKSNVVLDNLARIETSADAKWIKDGLLDSHLFKVEYVHKELEKNVQFLQEGKHHQTQLGKIT